MVIIDSRRESPSRGVLACNVPIEPSWPVFIAWNIYLVFIMVAIGGVAWVFIYPFLSGERAAELRVALRLYRVEITGILRPGREAETRAPVGHRDQRPPGPDVRFPETILRRRGRGESPKPAGRTENLPNTSHCRCASDAGTQTETQSFAMMRRDGARRLGGHPGREF